jgi:hypothetical protein
LWMGRIEVEEHEDEVKATRKDRSEFPSQRHETG